MVGSGNQLNKIEEATLALLANALFDAKRPIPDGVDWRRVYTECTAQAVVGVAHSAIEGLPLDNALRGEWDRAFSRIVASAVYAEQKHALIHTLLTDAGIPYVILKGCASASYYPNPWLRMMGDVDFLVTQEHAGAADALLTDNGFVRMRGFHHCEHAYHRGGIRVELHWAVNGIPEGHEGDTLRRNLSDIYTCAAPSPVTDGVYMKPSVFHHGLVIIAHTAGHLTASGLGLRHLCDWAVFVASLGDQEFSDMFKGPLEEAGLWRFARLLTQLSVRVLGCPPRDWAGKEEPELISEMLADIFASGNFGAKCPDRGDQSPFITDPGRGGAGGSMPLRMLGSANTIVSLRWPAAKRFPLLYPVGWCWFGVRYAVLSLFGKRKRLHVGRLMKGAKKRAELYEKLELFKVK